MKVKKLAGLIATIVAISMVSGCAVVSESQVDEKVFETRRQINAANSAQMMKVTEPLVKKVKGSYLTSKPIPIAYDATLPPIFRDTILKFPGRTNLATVASRITEATNLPVRIREDVYYSPKSLAAGNVSGSTNATSGVNLPLPLPGETRDVKSLSNSFGIANRKTEDFDLSVSMDYNGPLSGYLDLLCNSIGVNWEYREGTIYIYRMMTKTFQVKVNPGSVDFSSALSKGGSTTTGASGPGASSNGSFSSESSTTMKGKFSVWDSLEAAIKGMLTPLGKVTIAQSSGNIIVTDTKEALSEIGRMIDAENATLSRQVQVDVRIVRVGVTNSSTAGANVNLAYSKLDAAGSAAKWILNGTAPGNLTSTSALLPGGLGARIVSPTSPFSGSGLFVDALNQIGKVVSDETVSAITTNRVPVPIGQFSTVTYLAQTTPATGGGSGSSPGLPGLTPGSVTTGFFLNVIPTVLDNNSVLMRLSLDESTLTKMGSITTGTGDTQQQIQTPNTDGSKSDHSIGLREGESLVLMGVSKDKTNYDKAFAMSGLSNSASSTKEMQVIIITPRVRPGI